MRRLRKASLFLILAVPAFAQRGGMHAGGSHAASSRPVPNSRVRFNTAQRGFPRRTFFNSYGLGYPWLGGYDYLGGYDNYDYDHGYDYQPEPPLMAAPPAQLPPMQVIVQPPPRPIRPEIKEYNPPDTGDSKPFSISLKDGSVRTALAVWVTGDGMLHYIDAEGKPGRTLLDSVDRAATKKVNDGKSVQSWLP